MADAGTCAQFNAHPRARYATYQQLSSPIVRIPSAPPELLTKQCGKGIAHTDLGNLKNHCRQAARPNYLCIQAYCIRGEARLELQKTRHRQLACSSVWFHRDLLHCCLLLVKIQEKPKLNSASQAVLATLREVSERNLRRGSIA
jgi:hypothetical protein